MTSSCWESASFARGREFEPGLRHKKRPPKRPNLCWISRFVQNRINEFGRRQKCGCLIQLIRLCLNISIHYFVVLSLVREPLKRKKRSSFEPDLLLCFVQFLKLKFFSFQIRFCICFGYFVAKLYQCFNL